MPKLSCICGYVHDLTPVPDEGFLVIKDIDYEKLIEAEIQREKLSSVKMGTDDWDKLIEHDRFVCDATERLYECPNCKRLMWLRNDNNNHIYNLEDRISTIYGDYEFNSKNVTEPIDNKQFIMSIDRLINLWCDRKCLKPLGIVLSYWPLINGLTDEWKDLQRALKQIVSTCKNELEKYEQIQLQNCIRYIGRLF